jgi:acyl-CoA thioester hydrolase
MSESLLTGRSVVYPWQCDHMGHLNVMWYVGKFDEATWQLFALLGLTPTFLRKEHRGMAAVHQEITYKRELHAGDLISIASSLVEVREKVLRFTHEMFNAETQELAAVTTITAVYFDTEVRVSCPLPAQIRERAQAMCKAHGSA